MDERAVRAVLRHYIDHSGTDEDAAHEIYPDDAVLEFPQSGERFEGVANLREWRREYPADVDLEVVRVRGGGDTRFAELRISYDHGERQPAVDILEFRGDRVARETIYVAEGFAAPQWRARWRTAPPQEE